MEELLRTVFGRKIETASQPPDEGDTSGADSRLVAGGRDDRAKRGWKRGMPHPGRADLPVHDKLLDLPEPERRCQSCGQACVRSGAGTGWIYATDWQAAARRIRRQQYRSACSCAEARGARNWFPVQAFSLFRARADGHPTADSFFWV